MSFVLPSFSTTLTFLQFHSRYPSARQYASAELEHPPQHILLSINYPFDDDSPTQGALPKLLSELPPQKILETFIEQYLSTIDKLSNILYRPSFEPDLAQYWNGRQPPFNDWMAMFLMVLALGCQIYNATASTSGLRTYYGLPSELLHGAAVYLKRTPFLYRPTMNNIRTLCLMAIAKQIYVTSCAASDTCWPFVGMIVRLAIGMGLNSRTESTGFDEREAGRLWNAVVFMDLKQSMICGMPLLLRGKDVTVLSDSSYGLDNAQGESGEISLTEKMLPQAFPTLVRALELANAPDDTANANEIVQLDQDLRKHLKGPGVDLISRQNEATDLETCLLDLLFRRGLLILHSRYAFQDNASTRFPLSYISSLECSLGILRHQRNLCEKDPSSGELPKTAWIAGLFKDNFFTAAMTICTQLTSDGAILEMGQCNDGSSRQSAKQVILDALQSCRDLWKREKNMSICTTSAFGIIDQCVKELGGGSDTPRQDSALSEDVMAQWGGKEWMW